MGGKKGGGSRGPAGYKGDARRQYVEAAKKQHGNSMVPNFSGGGTWEGYVNRVENANKPPPAPAFEMPDLGAIFSSSQSSASDQAAALAQQQREAELAAKRRERDELYSEYLDAATTATDFINNQLKSEAANAALLGVEFQVPEEQKQQRIQDYFASIWGEGAQTRLETLFDQVGAVEGFEGFDLERGNAENVTEQKSGSERTVSRSRGRKRQTKSLATSDEDETLGSTTILGG